MTTHPFSYIDHLSTSVASSIICLFLKDGQFQFSFNREKKHNKATNLITKTISSTFLPLFYLCTQYNQSQKSITHQVNIIIQHGKTHCSSFHFLKLIQSFNLDKYLCLLFLSPSYLHQLLSSNWCDYNFSLNRFRNTTSLYEFLNPFWIDCFFQIHRLSFVLPNNKFCSSPFLGVLLIFLPAE